MQSLQGRAYVVISSESEEEQDIETTQRAKQRKLTHDEPPTYTGSAADSSNALSVMRSESSNASAANPRFSSSFWFLELIFL